ncbi:MAG: flagellar motor protein MotB [Beijerinckiaceae bacterium]
MAKKKRGGHGGGHGGWFVTFADLMGLLMSFFVMLTAFSTQDAKKLSAVAGSMREAFGNQKNPRLAGIVEADGIPTRPHLKNVKIAPPEEGSDYTVPDDKNQKDNANQQRAAERKFAAAAASLRQAMMDMPEMAELSKQIMIEETREGLSISLVDQDGRSMFAEGSLQPYERTRRAIEAIANFLRRMPNRIAVTGHTSAPRAGASAAWSNWELSAGRAAAVREIMARSGIPDGRFHAISGKADTDPMFPDNPYFSANRRVTILMMRDEPPLPASARP